MRQALGLYIHVPFCKRKCNYCDFYSVTADPDRIRRYADAVISDIEHQATRFQLDHFDTLFVGGGTPSVMGRDLIRVIEKAIHSFSFTPDAEMTCEANPESLSAELLMELWQTGINRISIGAQSFCDDELRDLGRLHDRERILWACQEIRRAGFENLNVDIMFGIGHRNCRGGHLQSFSRTLDEILALDIPHISCYNLTVQEHTALCRSLEKYRFADEDEEERMYELLCRRLVQHGYEHYEISNFAKPGYACRHNIKYWKSLPYLGIGPAAHSYIGAIRYSHPANLERYISGRIPDITEEVITAQDLARERLIMGLRMREGVQYSELSGVFDLGKLHALVDELDAHGLTEKRGDGFSLTEKGFRISNAVINRFLDCDKGDR